MAIELRAEEAAERSLVGLLVEIGTVDKIEPDASIQALYPDAEPIDVSGERGRVVAWAADQGKYLVHTFGGIIVYIAEDKLTEYEPPEAEEPGGFDVAWPAVPGAAPGAKSVVSMQELFAAQVSDKIMDQGFCVVQMFEGNDHAAEVVDTCREYLDWGTLKEDVEEEYLGEEPSEGKVAWLQYQAGSQEGRATGMRTYDLEDMGANMNVEGLGGLEKVDQTMTNIAALLSPFVPDWDDEKAFMAWGRTNALARASFEADDDKKWLKRHSLGADDEVELDDHLAFVDAKKLCIMYLVENEGGELVLTPAEEAYDYNMVNIPLTKNKVVIFRCDQLGLTCSYKPAGRSLCLQTWVMDLPSIMREREEALRYIDGPEEPKGQRNQVMSMMTRYPGCGFEPLAYWSMLQSGSDTQICVPATRWDIDIYYRKEHTIGFSMTCHGAMLQHSEVTNFDNKFFGISPQESACLAPYMRVMLEVGYETLHRAGHTRGEMRDWNCGVFVGDSGSDWDNLFEPHVSPQNLQWRFAGRERSAACARLSHIMGMKGPVSTAETACSSSLVAAGIAQMTMRMKQQDQKSPSIATDLYHGLVIGSNTIIGVMSYISLSGPGMLTSHGRCFTFDQSADGFARGEGIGGVKLKVCNNEQEAMDRIAVLIGCTVNQDGRSASMTAPHGPSQQAVIRDSMREGGLSPKQITIAECHGTGTALGDPIEVGALRGVLGAARQQPILKTSAKTNIGHLEAGAGVAGLIKCICMLNYSTGSPNCHLVTLNPHLDVAGFPVLFETEACDYGANSGLTGVSSFGFGGTNARADVWGHATHGSRYCISGVIVKPQQL
eukprot:CAMPEP_0115625730 /NCGR_PEP_ID=MMETSP0272-20121206/27971_1 /TAXON_ID=71861 /ORGANISM="Scrippsiella trochoidea, Strain CCMP3099" /LENGTH=830 /DNA_ID=CAMNT_0003062047 /DNA_START=160 /DNA_END=2649 /DNA_ORIENTATION=+